MIYLDFNATAPPLPQVIDAMAAEWQSCLGNPASQHQLGQQARRRLEAARSSLLTQLGGIDGQDQLILTSGATEANNLALRGLVRADEGHVVISSLEHPSILGTADWLMSQGITVQRIQALPDGQIDLNHLEQLLAGRVQLVSVMLANHETGVLQPLQAISDLCRQHRTVLHTDATQAVGRLPLCGGELADALTFSAHKFGGPVGVGGLLLRQAVVERCQPLLLGGFQQAALRPGTESVALACGADTALQWWTEHGVEARRHILGLRDAFEARLQALALEVTFHGSQSPRNPQTSNVGFVGLDRQALWLALDQAGVACSTGSACASGSSEPSPVLVSMGLPQAQIDGALRFSFGWSSTASELEQAADHISRICNNLRSSSYGRKRPWSGRDNGPKRV